MPIPGIHLPEKSQKKSILSFQKSGRKVNPNKNMLKILIFRIHTREKQT